MKSNACAVQSISQTDFQDLPHTISRRQCKIEAQIYGVNYQFAADSEPEYIRQLARDVDERMRNIAAQNPQLGPMRIALLTMLELAAEVKAAERAIESQELSLSRRCVELERDIEELLGVA